MNTKLIRSFNADAHESAEGQHREQRAPRRPPSRPELTLVRPPTSRDSGGFVAKKAAPHTILIVENVPAVCEFLSRALRMSGYEVAVAKSPVEALILSDYICPSAILIDVSMPGEGGMTTLNMLRSRGNKRMIIMLAGHATTKSARLALLAGADDYVAGPLSKDFIRSIVRDAVGDGAAPERSGPCAR